MAFEQHLQNETKSARPTEAWKSFADESENATSLPGFECNICLETVQDPVVTLCGHLFCWPCIYKWIHFKSAAATQCPVCKSTVTESSLVPLYGRGGGGEENYQTAPKPHPHSKGKAPSLGIVVPRRPQFCATGDYNSPRTPQFLSPGPQTYSPGPQSQRVATNLMDPGAGLYGEMVYARMFGNSITNFYTYPNSYRLAGNASPRVRRHVMQADRSLSRVCFFLFCCFVLCLLLF